MTGDDLLIQMTAALVAFTPARRKILILTMLSFMVLC